MSDIECPYCKKDVNIKHDDGAGYSEYETHYQQCKHCKLTFAFTTSIIFLYDAFPEDCIDNE